MSYSVNPYRKLTDDVDIGTMLSMRQQGMSNKQIAFRLGVSPTTIYKYIGRKSDAAKVAEMQGKPMSSVCPPVQPETSPDEQASTENEAQESQKCRKRRISVPQTTAQKAESATVVVSETISVIDSQKKECRREETLQPVAEVQPEAPIEEKKVNEMTQETKKSSLRVVALRQTLQGSLCKYVVDTESDSIEIDGGGLLTGMLDKATLDALIEELIEIKGMFPQ